MPISLDFDNSTAGVRAPNLTPQSKVVDFFDVFWTQDLLTTIADESNRFFGFMQAGRVIPRQSRDTKWNDVTWQELKLFLALAVLMGLIRKRALKDYWTTDPIMMTPIFGQVMPRNRFALILRSLHFCDNVQGFLGSATSKIRKINMVYESMKKSFSESFKPFQNLVIDESLVLWRGNLAFKQYIPSKRHRFGIKLFVICDCKTGYVLGIILYTGATTLTDIDPELGLSGSIVKTLMEPYLDKNHILFTDNWYTSPKLVKFLYSRGTGACGTVRRNRKRMPQVPTLRERGEVTFSQCDTMLATFWKDKREVSLLSNVHRPRMVQSENLDPRTREKIMQPECVIDYNVNMRLVDRSDAMISSVECTRRTLKWYKRFFFHLVDMSMLNAHILFMSVTKKKCTLPEFVLEVVRNIFEDEAPATRQSSARRPVDSPLRLTGRHFCRPIPVPAATKKGRVQRACHVCKNTTRKSPARKDTRYYCEECNVPLCVHPCFEDYHTVSRY